MHIHSHTSDLTLALSFFFGALHALEPGHGKTAMIVYFLGGQRSAWHPLVMGVSTALSHSVSLMAIALTVHFAHHMVIGDHFHEEQVSLVLQWLSGGILIAIGAYLFGLAAFGRKTKCCSHCQHREQVEPAPVLMSLDANSLSNPPAPRQSRPDNFRTTALLGIAVGLLPCPSALAAYFAGLSSGSPAAAYGMVALFAAGIACSLALVGLLLQRSGERLCGYMRHASHFPWGLIRAGLITAVGVFYTVRLVV